MVSGTLTTKTQRPRNRTNKKALYKNGFLRATFAFFEASWLGHSALQRAREGGRSFAVADHRRDACGGGELGAHIDRRHGEIELGALGAAGEHDADRMEQRLPLLTRARLHTVRH